MPYPNKTGKGYSIKNKGWSKFLDPRTVSWIFKTPRPVSWIFKTPKLRNLRNIVFYYNEQKAVMGIPQESLNTQVIL